jgi:3-hydroxybutyryl-CoA dehydrogenase
MEVVWKSRDQRTLDASVEVVKERISRKYPDRWSEMASNIHQTKDFRDLSDVDLIVECALEEMNVKKRVFGELDSVCDRKTIFTTNTSSLSVTEIAMETKRRDQFAGLHFFNPPTAMKLVEIIKTQDTSEKTINTLKDLVSRLDHEWVIVEDTPGFIVNYLLMLYLNEAAGLSEQSAASRGDIDKAMKLGLNHPMGPFELMDLIGLDVVYAVLNNLHKRSGDLKFKSCGIIRRLVEEGKFGRKSGEGFYKY